MINLSQVKDNLIQDNKPSYNEFGISLLALHFLEKTR